MVTLNVENARTNTCSAHDALMYKTIRHTLITTTHDAEYNKWFALSFQVISLTEYGTE